jgi:hypothetical protein
METEGFPAGTRIETTTNQMWQLDATRVLARHFFQCIACSEYLVIEAPQARWGQPVLPAESCPFCGALFAESRPRYCGRVNRGQLVKDHDESPCDGACTMAVGWQCDCSCGGMNHGSRLVIWRVSAAGAAPEVLPVPEKKVTTATARREEWTLALAAAESRIETKYGEVFRRKESGTWLSNAEFAAYRLGRTAEKELYSARSLKTHAGRIKKVAKVATEGATE